ncbi:MAG: hypothetical protein FI681_00585 [SAR202 cluster bacterium]|uniref:DUF5666 domain-containing protein n=1 Tax=marine metagenome TaxID=408172 RepID=A0A382CAI0_9ZZZZ|nr:hypothetical protein [SAR202 cluster bacterium]
MRNLILIISIAILIGGTYSIGFYNGNNNASKTITLAKNGGEQYLKLNPPGKTVSELKNNENSYTDEEGKILAKLKSGEITLDEVPEDLRNKLRSEFAQTRPNLNPLSNLQGSKSKGETDNFKPGRSLSGKITKIENDYLEIETEMGVIQIIVSDSTLIKSTSKVNKSDLSINTTISVSGQREDTGFKAKEIIITK